VKKGSFQLPNNISADFQDLLKNIITWDSNKRFNMTQIINHTFFTGNKFSFCIPSTTINLIQPISNPNISLSINRPDSTNPNPLILTPELVKTTERTNIDLKPRKIFQKQDNSKSDRESKLSENKIINGKSSKSISSSVGSKAFLKNFESGNAEGLLKKTHKPSFDMKENVFIHANLKENVVKIKENVKMTQNFDNNHNNMSVLNYNRINRSKDNIVNKSIEIIPKASLQNKNELEKYLKTEIDATPAKSKKNSKV